MLPFLERERERGIILKGRVMEKVKGHRVRERDIE